MLNRVYRVVQFQHLMNVYFSFCRSIRSPPLRTRKKMFSTVFSESRVLPQKKKLLDLQKKPKVKQKKLRIAIKQKREWKRKKKSSKQRLTPHTYSHTRSKLHYIHTLIHQNFILKYHPCHQINQSTKPPILDFYSSLIAVPKH